MNRINKENIPPNHVHIPRAALKEKNNKQNADSFLKRTHSMDVQQKHQTLIAHNMMDVEPLESQFNRFPTAMEVEDSADMNTFDKANKHNPQMVSLYAKQIFEYLRGREGLYLAQEGYMSGQSDINEKMRSILIDWLVDVNVKFRLVPETLFLTVNLIDRFLGKSKVSRNKLQLVGVSSLLIACKYEEIYPPSLKEFVAICDRAYTAAEILDMEAHILLSLQFEMTHSSSLRFLDRFAQIAEVDQKAYYFARYLLETVLLEYSLLRYSNSILAAGAIFLVNKIFKKHGWTAELQVHTGYSEADVKPCAKDIYFTMQNSEKLVLHAVKRKFSSAKFMEVSKYRIEKVPSSRPN